MGDDNQAVVRAIAELERGRESYAKHAWLDAYRAMTAAAEAVGLGAEDFELLARWAYMLGRDDDYVGGLERAHQLHLDAGEALRAVRCAFWIGHNMLFRGETVRARGWFARWHRASSRAQRPLGALLLMVRAIGERRAAEHLADVLADESTVVTYDRCGCGRSPQPRG